MCIVHLEWVDARVLGNGGVKGHVLALEAYEGVGVDEGTTIFLVPPYRSVKMAFAPMLDAIQWQADDERWWGRGKKCIERTSERDEANA
jgi:hypothetical protein